MNCRECKNYKNKKCSVGSLIFRDGVIDAVNYNLYGMIFKNGEYIDCDKFIDIDELTLFDFEGE